jgi:hypothetical protein
MTSKGLRKLQKRQKSPVVSQRRCKYMEDISIKMKGEKNV